MKVQIEELKKIHDSMVAGFNELPPFAKLAAPELVKRARLDIHNLGCVIAQLEFNNVNEK